jgi:hypothetical protein
MQRCTGEDALSVAFLSALISSSIFVRRRERALDSSYTARAQGGGQPDYSLAEQEDNPCLVMFASDVALMSNLVTQQHALEWHRVALTGASWRPVCGAEIRCLSCDAVLMVQLDLLQHQRGCRYATKQQGKWAAQTSIVPPSALLHCAFTHLGPAPAALAAFLRCDTHLQRFGDTLASAEQVSGKRPTTNSWQPSRFDL